MSQLYFKAFFDLLETVEELSHEEVGRLFLACLEYGKTGVAPQLPGNERFVFPGIRAQIDRDRNSYTTRCEANRKNGEKGGRPAKVKETEKNQGKRKNPIGYFETEKSQDKEKDKEKEYIPPLPPTGDEADTSFETFYSAYPKKRARRDAEKAWAKLKPDEALLETIMQALEAEKQSPDWQKNNGQFIPYPASWLNGRRWEDQPARASPPRPAVFEDDLPEELFAFYGGAQ